MLALASFQAKFAEAAESCAQLDKCNWSPASSTYVRALCLFMLAEKEEDGEKKAQKMDLVIELLKSVPARKRTMGGKKAFHEKFVLENSIRYSECPQKMLMPIYDVAYLFNFFQMFAGKPGQMQPILDEVTTKLTALSNHSQRFYHDHKSYLTFLQGICQKQLGNLEQAAACFEHVLTFEHLVAENTHLAPQACFELGNMLRKQQRNEEAKSWLEKALKYSCYSTELLIRYRTQVASDAMGKLRRISTTQMFPFVMREE